MLARSGRDSGFGRQNGTVVLLYLVRHVSWSYINWSLIRVILSCAWFISMSCEWDAACDLECDLYVENLRHGSFQPSTDTVAKQRVEECRYVIGDVARSPSSTRPWTEGNKWRNWSPIDLQCALKITIWSISISIQILHESTATVRACPHQDIKLSDQSESCALRFETRRLRPHFTFTFCISIILCALETSGMRQSFHFGLRCAKIRSELTCRASKGEKWSKRCCKSGEGRKQP